MSIRIRVATENDADQVVALYGEFTQYIQALGDATDARLTAEIYRRDGFGENRAFFGLIAELENEVIGYLLYHFGYDTELAARVIYIMDLYVAERHRMQGVAASLVTEAESISREHGVKEILWSVYKLNPRAREFYEKLGAKLIDDLDYMYLEVGGADGKTGSAA
jgi:GNAT superfamily N-acetyltransferase